MLDTLLGMTLPNVHVVSYQGAMAHGEGKDIVILERRQVEEAES